MDDDGVLRCVRSTYTAEYNHWNHRVHLSDVDPTISMCKIESELYVDS